MNLTEVPLQDLVDELKRRRQLCDKAITPFQHLTEGSREAVEAVILAVCKQWGISRQMLFSSGRPKHVTDPRQAAMEIMRNHLFLTLEGVGEVFGKDYGTVIHACNTHQARMGDPAFKRRYTAALHAIKKHSLEAAGFSISVS